MTTPLDVSASVKLVDSGDGLTGTGTVQLGPARVRERWELTQAAVTASSNVLEASCALYLGNGSTPTTRLQTTGTGSTGDVYGFGQLVMQPGQSLVATWTGGDIGATATLRLLGTIKRFPG